MSLLFILLAALLPRPVPCDVYKTNITEINTTIVLDNESQNTTTTLQLPVVCFAPRYTNQTISLSVKGGFFELYDFNGFIPSFMFGNNISNVTIDNATIYRHKCLELKVIRQSGIRMCNSATMDIPYVAPPSRVPVSTKMNVTVVNCEPCQKFNGTRLVHVVWEELLDLTVAKIVPNLICTKQDQKVSIMGTDFLQFLVKKGNKVYPPTVHFNGMNLNVTINQQSCINFTASNVTTQLCTEIAAVIPKSDVNYFTDNELVVQNPLPCLTSSVSVPNAISIYTC